VTAVPAEAPILGSTMPRIWTPPLVTGEPGTCGCGCALDQNNSYGFDVVDFARDVLRQPLDPWQRWVIIHAGELLPDGRPRFRTVFILVARQGGKTFLGVVLTLYWLFIERQKLVLGTSTNRDTAKESWRAAVHAAQECEWLAEEIAPQGVRFANGEETLETTSGCRYRIAASNRRGGRGMTINRLILDELREHKTFEAWDAATPATNAVPDAQIWAISNQGDEESAVLDALRLPAIEYIETGKGDRRLGLFEWSAPPGADPTDPHALAAANPNYGRRTDPDALHGQAIRAKAAGGAELASFRTEILCQRVHQLDPAIDPDGWAACGTDTPQDLAPHRRNVALCVDLALDGSHATLAAAVVLDGTVHVEIVRHWEGYGCSRALRETLPSVVARVKPGAVGWFPAGPAAAVAAELAERKGGAWPPPYVKVEEIRGGVPAVCMGLAELVTTRQLAHPRDDLLNSHVNAAQRVVRGDSWVFGRQGSGPIDAVYAIAGAAHLARTMAVRPKPKVVTRKSREERQLRPV
jgi:hypothetical protein